MTTEKYQAIFAALALAIPNPRSELIYHSHFELLIAVVLSAQATDKSVNKATAQLFPIANTPQAIFNLGEEKLKTYIKTIGLYNSKAANIIKLCERLLEKHQGEVPETRVELEALAGVGRKTANVMLNTAFGQPTIAVDTHIFRVANRIGLAAGKNVNEVEQQLLNNVPTQYLNNAHHLLILQGRYVCMARKPRCGDCPIIVWCEFTEKIKLS